MLDQARPSTGRTHPAALVAVVLLGASGACARALRLGLHNAGLAAALLIVAGVVAAVAEFRPLRRRGSPLIVGLAVAAAAVASANEYVKPFGFVVVFTALASAAIVRWRPLPDWPQRHSSTAPLAIGIIIAANVAWVRSPSTVLAAIMAAAATLVLELFARAPRFTAAVEGAIARFAVAAGHTVSVVFALIAWIVAVLPTWAVARLTRSDPLDPRLATIDTAWIVTDPARSRTRFDAPRAPQRLGRKEPPASPSARRGRRARRAIVSVAAVAVAVVLVQRSTSGGVTTADLTQRMDDVADEDLTWSGVKVLGYAYTDEPWVPSLFRAFYVGGPRHDLILGQRLQDFSSRYYNVANGTRATYTPDDPEIEVWFFGGSTMHGIGQRDDHTIASEVVRLAERDGHRIRASNFGVAGDVNWVETIRFAEALETPRPKPALAVFYDGWNDWSTGQYRADLRNLDGDTSERLAVSDAERNLHEGAFGRRPPLEQGPERTEAEISLAAAQYRRGVLTDRTLAAAHGVLVLNYWQPITVTKEPGPADAELDDIIGLDDSRRAASARDYRTIRERSDVDAIDLTRALDGVDRPVYLDDGHHNELGARTIAAAMYETLEPELERIDPQH